MSRPTECKDQAMLGQAAYEHTFDIVPCPICKTDKWIRMKTVLEYTGTKDCGVDIFYCGACGLSAQTTSARIYAADYWNRLVRRIQSGNPNHA